MTTCWTIPRTTMEITTGILICASTTVTVLLEFLEFIWTFLNFYHLKTTELAMFFKGRLNGKPAHTKLPCEKDLNLQISEQTTMLLQCCYKTVDSAMAASQNGFCSYRLSIHSKNNIMQIMTKNIRIFIYFIFYHKEIVKLDHFMTLSFELCKHSSVMQPLQNPPFCVSTTVTYVVYLLIYKFRSYTGQFSVQKYARVFYLISS